MEFKHKVARKSNLIAIPHIPKNNYKNCDIEYLKHFNQKELSESARYRFSPEIASRINNYLEARVRDMDDDSVDKKRIIEKADFFRNELMGYSVESRRTKKKDTQNLSYTILPILCVTYEITFKELLEACLDANVGIYDMNSEGWTHITWPTEALQSLHDCLIKMSKTQCGKVLNLVRKLQPPAYESFMARLYESSGEFGDRRVKPEYLSDKEANKYLKLTNLSNRIYETALYTSTISNRRDPPVVAKEAGIKYNIRELTHRYQFWSLISLGEFDKVCKLLKLSPHWAFLGNDYRYTLMTENSDHERILDEFSFLPDMLQCVVVEYAREILRKVGKQV